MDSHSGASWTCLRAPAHAHTQRCAQARSQRPSIVPHVASDALCFKLRAPCAPLLLGAAGIRPSLLSSRLQGGSSSSICGCSRRLRRRGSTLCASLGDSLSGVSSPRLRELLTSSDVVAHRPQCVFSGFLVSLVSRRGCQCTVCAGSITMISAKGDVARAPPRTSLDGHRATRSLRCHAGSLRLEAALLQLSTHRADCASRTCLRRLRLPLGLWAPHQRRLHAPTPQTHLAASSALYLRLRQRAAQPALQRLGYGCVLGTLAEDFRLGHAQRLLPVAAQLSGHGQLLQQNCALTRKGTRLRAGAQVTRARASSAVKPVRASRSRYATRSVSSFASARDTEPALPAPPPSWNFAHTSRSFWLASANVDPKPALGVCADILRADHVNSLRQRMSTTTTIRRTTYADS